MNKKFATWLRWILVFPGAIILGFLATFPLHLLLQILFSSGEADLFSLRFFAQTLSFGKSYIEIEYLLSPFIIAIVYIIAGAGIAPKYKFKTGLILFCIYILVWSIFSIISISQNGLSNGQFSGRTILAVAGALLGLIIVKFNNRNNNKKKNTVYEFGTNRKRTELDDILDQVVLDNYYESSKEERTPKKDKEILEKSYIKPKS